LVNKALGKVEEVIKMKGGKFEKKGEPKVVGEKDDDELSESIEGHTIVMSSDDDEEGIDIDIPSRFWFK